MLFICKIFWSSLPFPLTSSPWTLLLYEYSSSSCDKLVLDLKWTDRKRITWGKCLSNRLKRITERLRAPQTDCQNPLLLDLSRNSNSSRSRYSLLSRTYTLSIFATACINIVASSCIARAVGCRQSSERHHLRSPIHHLELQSFLNLKNVEVRFSVTYQRFSIFFMRNRIKKILDVEDEFWQIVILGCTSNYLMTWYREGSIWHCQLKKKSLLLWNLSSTLKNTVQNERITVRWSPLQNGEYSTEGMLEEKYLLQKISRTNTQTDTKDNR